MMWANWFYIPVIASACRGRSAVVTELHCIVIAVAIEEERQRNQPALSNLQGAIHQQLD
jgi:hypothetical protein